MSDFTRSASPDTLITAGVHLLIPPIRAIYAVLVQAGIVVVDGD